MHTIAKELLNRSDLAFLGGFISGLVFWTWVNYRSQLDREKKALRGKRKSDLDI